ncbi:MAG TPA: type I methionyl aminopeptidase [Deltaproteobacteria bacterium]|nr:type I methionyl aminopeptidase [Deltaproteobacteria bacterium]HOM28680.1 type I methionyl aminopeptidase [Deltaproteobacteria bacterium]HPP80170.1 type I methionyl aminopeptidase [Deltaproteobacteria bacterium]
MIVLKSPREIATMREANRILALLFEHLQGLIQPGVTTAELDQEAELFIRSHNAVPAFKGYRGYPATLCTSVNEEVIHGIPSKRKLRKGDIVSIDVGAVYEGFYSDSARTFPVGEVSDDALRLMEATERALMEGIERARPGNRLHDISAAIQDVVERAGFSVVREFVGHGIGRSLHEDPQVPNFGRKGSGPLLQEGMTLAIEPMVNQGTWKVEILDDGWTAVTADGSLSAHFEHSIAITSNGPVILSVL